MKTLRYLFRFTGCVGILLSPAAVSGLTVDAGDGGSREILSSAAIVEGRPAIAYTGDGNFTVKYVRAADSSGSVWETPITVDGEPEAGERVSLLIVNGNPAICYHGSAAGGGIKFVRAVDSSGSVWGAPTYVDAGDGLQVGYSIEVVDGNPAISFIDGFGDLRFIRALDASGSAWGRLVTVKTSGNQSFRETSMKVVRGHPAIVFSGDPRLQYIRASDATGDRWDEPPVQVIPFGAEGFGKSPSLLVVNGQPAVSFFASTVELIYVRAADGRGTAWGAPITVDGEKRVGYRSQSSLAIVNGKPALGYSFNYSDDLKYAEALNNEGATAAAWGRPVTVVSTGGPGRALSLIQVHGGPALAYPDTTHGSLNFLRVTDATGGQWPPDIQLEQPAGNLISTGGIRSFGVVAVGTGADLRFTLTDQNLVRAAITNVQATIGGPNASEFLIAAPPSPVPGDGSATGFAVRYAPVIPGLKTAALHLSYLADGVSYAFDITLTGNSIPDISLEQLDGRVLEDGETIISPLTSPDTVSDFVFTVRNSGGAELSGLAVGVDGPDSGEFSLAATPAPAVTPGGTTSFTLRHAFGAGGKKTATLHLVSNVSGSKNPFDLTVLMKSGTRDESFHASDLAPVGFMSLQADGKVLTSDLELLSRLNADGSSDTSFFSPPVGEGAISCHAVQKDGRILVGGDFDRVGGRSRPGLARLNAKGDLDETFAPGFTAAVTCFVIQSDGKILVGGSLRLAGGVPRPWLGRVSAEGALDPSFDPRPDDSVLCMTLQPDGKILIGGAFHSINGKEAQHIARLNADGIVDTFFAALSGQVMCIAVEEGGRIYAGGSFSDGVVRFLPDGTRDSFMSRSNIDFEGDIKDLALQTDGKCLTTYADINRPWGVTLHGIARINPDGSLEADFDPNPVGSIWRLALQADGKCLTAGIFANDMGEWSAGFPRLNNDFASTMLKTEGRSTVRWMRSGSAPEVRDATFELNFAGAHDWTPLGTGKRIPGGWELTGLTLPASGNIRAQGYAGGSVMETVIPIPTALERWRQQYFGITSNTGDAADNADPDHDGLVNLVEFAFGLPPVERGSGLPPVFDYTGTSFSASFTAPEDRESVLYGAEWSPSMLPGSWVVIPDAGVAKQHLFSVSGGEAKVFVRYTVKIR